MFRWRSAGPGFKTGELKRLCPESRHRGQSKRDNLPTFTQSRWRQRSLTEGLLGKAQSRQLPLSLMLIYIAFVCISYFSNQLPAPRNVFWSKPRCQKQQLKENLPQCTNSLGRRRGRSLSKFARTNTTVPTQNMQHSWLILLYDKENSARTVCGDSETQRKSDARRVDEFFSESHHT